MISLFMSLAWKKALVYYILISVVGAGNRPWGELVLVYCLFDRFSICMENRIEAE